MKILFAAILTFSFCYTKGQNPVFTFIQDGKHLTVKTGDSVVLERKAFSIRFFGKRYDETNNKLHAVQVAVVGKAEEAALAQPGMNIDTLPYFGPGTGIAGDEIYDDLFIDNEGHNYIFYAGEKDKRADMINEKNGVLELEWKISNAFYNGEDVSFSNLPMNELYFVFFNNENLNPIIDNGELAVVKVIFK